MLLNDIGAERKGCMSCKGTCGYINLCEWGQKWKNWIIKIDQKDNSLNLQSNDNPEQVIQLLPKSESRLDFEANLTYLVVYHRDTRQIRYIDIDAITRSDRIDVSDKWQTIDTRSHKAICPLVHASGSVIWTTSSEVVMDFKCVWKSSHDIASIDLDHFDDYIKIEASDLKCSVLERSIIYGPFSRTKTPK